MLFAVLAGAAICRAQTQQPSVISAIESFRAGTRADRVTIIAAAMQFDDKDAAAFWPIYRKYEYERSTLEDRRAAVIKEYVEKYSTLTDADGKAMTERMFDWESRLIALKKTYFKKFNRALPALTVAKFFQLDHRIDLLVDMKVESALLPLGQQQSEQEVLRCSGTDADTTAKNCNQTQ
jgi:hypothetical protein